MLKPRQISSIPVLKFSFSNKEDLRDIIIDYVLHNIESENKSIPSKRYKSKRIKYPNITMKLNINKEEKEVSFDFVMILAKYIEFEKKNIYRKDCIEPLVVDILDFLDELEDKTKDVIYEIDTQKNGKKI